MECDYVSHHGLDWLPSVVDDADKVECDQGSSQNNNVRVNISVERIFNKVFKNRLNCFFLLSYVGNLSNRSFRFQAHA